MGCCLIALLGAIWPRVVLVLIYFFSPAIPTGLPHPPLAAAGLLLAPHHHPGVRTLHLLYGRRHEQHLVHRSRRAGLPARHRPIRLPALPPPRLSECRRPVDLLTTAPLADHTNAKVEIRPRIKVEVSKRLRSPFVVKFRRSGNFPERITPQGRYSSGAGKGLVSPQSGHTRATVVVILRKEHGRRSLAQRAANQGPGPLKPRGKKPVSGKAT